MNDLPDEIEVVEVGPRDGLQNEAAVIPTADKVSLICRMEAAGVRRIEVASFVNPRKVPQMADAEAVIAALPPSDATRIGLVLNRRGAERALATPIDQLGAVCVASDAFGIANQGQTSEQSVEIAKHIVALANDAGRAAQITIAVAFGCPFSGEVDPARVIEIARSVAASGTVEIALADTIGCAVPAQVAALVSAVAAEVRPLPIRVHFHETRGSGLANVWAAIAAGARTVDASVGGFGGCPFAPGAAGNVATEDVAWMLARSGIATRLDLSAAIDTARWLAQHIARPLPSRISGAPMFPPALLEPNPS